MSKRNENRPGYKKTKVGWIPDDWETVRLDSIIAKKKLGANYPSSESETGLPLIKMGNIGRGKIKLKRIEYIPSTFVYEKDFILHKGDVLFNTRNTLDLVGKVSIWNNELPQALFNSNLLKIVFKSAIISSSIYANFLFNAEYSLSQLRAFATGTTSVAARYNRDLMQMIVPIPPLPEQKKIAEILSTWDAAIERTRKLIDAKKRRKKALMQQLLTGKKRLPGFNEKWKEYPMGELFKERRETYYNDLPLLAITGDKGIIPASAIERKDSSNADKSKYKRIVPDDIGYNTMRMWQGVSAVSTLEGIVSPAYTICIPRNIVDVGFMGYFFKFPTVIHLFWRYSQGLVSDTLNLKYNNFSQIKVVIPPIKEQRRIAQVLSTADNEINLLEKKTHRSGKTKTRPDAKTSHRRNPCNS